jgi:hypothetical protein
MRVLDLIRVVDRTRRRLFEEGNGTEPIMMSPDYLEALLQAAEREIQDAGNKPGERHLVEVR